MMLNDLSFSFFRQRAQVKPRLLIGNAKYDRRESASNELPTEVWILEMKRF